jgi:hypothetical protein
MDFITNNLVPIVILVAIIIGVLVYMLFFNNKPTPTPTTPIPTTIVKKFAGAVGEFIPPSNSLNASNIAGPFFIQNVYPNYLAKAPIQINTSAMQVLNTDSSLIIYYTFPLNIASPTLIVNIGTLQTNAGNAYVTDPSNICTTYYNVNLGSLYTNSLGILRNTGGLSIRPTGNTLDNSISIAFWFSVDSFNNIIINNKQAINNLLLLYLSGGQQISVYYDINYTDPKTGNKSPYLIFSYIDATNKNTVTPIMSNITLNAWYHLTIIFSANNSNTYFLINSTFASLINLNPLSQVNILSFYIGGDNITSTPNYSNCFFTDFRIYTRELANSRSTQPSNIDEVTMIYNFGLQNINKFLLNPNIDATLISLYTYNKVDNVYSNIINNKIGTKTGTLSTNATVSNTLPLIYSYLICPPYINGYLNFADTKSFFTLESITIRLNMTFAFWIYTNTVGNLLNLTDSVNTINLSIINNTNNITFTYTTPNNKYNCTISGNIGPNLWYHVAFVSTGKSINFYLNGIFTNSCPIILVDKQVLSSNIIGYFNSTTGIGFIGGVTDFRIYQRTLSNNEVLQIYSFNNYNTVNNILYQLAPFTNILQIPNNPTAIVALNNDPSLVIYYNFSTNSNNYILNLATNTYDGQLVNISNTSSTFVLGSNKSLYSNLNSYLVNYQPISNISTTSQLHITFWFCINSLDNPINKLLSMLYNKNQSELYISINSDNKLHIYIDTVDKDKKDYTIGSGFTFQLNTWYFISINSDPTQPLITIVINNKTIFQLSVTFPLVVYNSLCIGANSFGFNYFNGYTYDFRLYNRSLNSVEQTNIYNYLVNNKIFNLNYTNDVSLLSHYTFNQNDIQINSDTTIIVSNKQNNIYKALLANNNMITTTTIKNINNLSNILQNPPLENGYILFQNITNNMILENNLLLYNNYSILFWFYTLSDGNIFIINSGSNYIDIQIPDNSNTIIVILNLNGVNKVVTLNYSIGANVWYHIAIVFIENLINNSYQILFYINGILLSSVANIPIILNTIKNPKISNIYTNNMIGYNNTAITFTAPQLSNSFIGGYTDLRLYGRSLSASEINQLYFYNLYVNNVNTNYSLAPYVGNMSQMPNASLYQLLITDSALVIYYTFQSLSNNYILNNATNLYDGIISVPSNNSNNYNLISDMIDTNFYVLNNVSLYSNGYNYLINSTPFAINNGITICFWLCINSYNPNIKNKILSILYNNSTSELYLYYDGKNLKFYNNSEATITNNVGINLNTWYFISLSSDTSNNTYLNINNSVIQLSLMFPNSIYNSITLLGDSFGYSIINAFMNDFKVYNRKLSQSEITTLYNYGVTFNNYALDNDSSLVSFYTFAAANVNNLTISNNIINANTCIASATGIINPSIIPYKTAPYPSATNGWLSLTTQAQNILLNSNNTTYLNYLPNNVNKSGTIAFWFYYSNKSQMGNILSLCSSNSYINVQLINNNNNVYLSIRTLNGSGGTFVENILNTNILTPNTWYHFSVVFIKPIDHNRQTLFISNYYINGNYISSGTATIFPSSDLRINNYIGAMPPPLLSGIAATGFVGGFTDLRIYIRGLAGAEINQIFNKK